MPLLDPIIRSLSGDRASVVRSLSQLASRDPSNEPVSKAPYIAPMVGSDVVLSVQRFLQFGSIAQNDLDLNNEASSSSPVQATGELALTINAGADVPSI